MVHLRKLPFTKGGKLRVLKEFEYKRVRNEFQNKYGIDIGSYEDYKLKVAKEKK
jgi:hypothetical protein